VGWSGREKAQQREEEWCQGTRRKHGSIFQIRYKGGRGSKGRLFQTMWPDAARQVMRKKGCAWRKLNKKSRNIGKALHENISLKTHLKTRIAGGGDTGPGYASQNMSRKREPFKEYDGQ